jgi:hypothetical protein
LSKPLPFGAYPFLAVTLFGWAWTHLRPARVTVLHATIAHRDTGRVQLQRI